LSATRRHACHRLRRAAVNLRALTCVVPDDYYEGNEAAVRALLLIAGALLTIAGTVFALQGFGVLGGSGMSGSHFWAGAGPVVAIVGLILLGLGSRRRSARGRL
jgi:uncharacterized membrane protein